MMDAPVSGPMCSDKPRAISVERLLFLQVPPTPQGLAQLPAPQSEDAQVPPAPHSAVTAQALPGCGPPTQTRAQALPGLGPPTHCVWGRADALRRQAVPTVAPGPTTVHSPAPKQFAPAPHSLTQ